VTTLYCPVLDCEWTESVPEPDPLATRPETLASVFGTGVMAAAAVAVHHQKTETALEKHFATHTLVDYVRTMESQRGALIVFEGSLERMQRDAVLFRRAVVEMAEALGLGAPPVDTRPPAGAAELSAWTSRAVAEIMRRTHRPRPNRTTEAS
jgi:hypothetical protein